MNLQLDLTVLMGYYAILQSREQRGKYPVEPCFLRSAPPSNIKEQNTAANKPSRAQ